MNRAGFLPHYLVCLDRVAISMFAMDTIFSRHATAWNCALSFSFLDNISENNLNSLFLLP